MSEERWTPPDLDPLDSRGFRSASHALALVSLVCWAAYIQDRAPRDSQFDWVRLWLAVAVVTTVFSGVSAVMSGVRASFHALAGKQPSQP